MDFIIIDTPLLTHFLELPCAVYSLRNEIILPLMKARTCLKSLKLEESDKLYLNKNDLYKIKDDLQERMQFNLFITRADITFDYDGFYTVFSEEILDAKSFLEIKKEYLNVLLFADSQLDLSDEFTRIKYFSHFQFSHSISLHYLFHLLSKECRWSTNLSSIFYLASYVHDIGMPDILVEEYQESVESYEIDDEAMELLVKHPERSVRLLDSSGKCPAIVKDIILNHHEYINGDGYPHGLKLEKQTIEVQVFALVHLWLNKAIALSSNSQLRPYHFLNTWDDRWEQLKAEPYLTVLYKYFSKIMV